MKILLCIFGLIILFGAFIQFVESCWSPPAPPWRPPPTPPPKRTRRPKPDPYALNINGALGGFPIPPELREKWKSWLKNYQNERLLENSAIGEVRPDFPENWQGLGPGFSGFPPHSPPHWGYKPKDMGLPSYCYDSPDEGVKCTDGREWESRWAFNPYMDHCEQFEYNGCHGNGNNFKTKAKCEKQCILHQPEGCDKMTDIPLPFGGQLGDGGIFTQFVRKCG